MCAKHEATSYFKKPKEQAQCLKTAVMLTRVDPDDSGNINHDTNFPVLPPWINLW